MTQVSRPYQIALAVLALFAAVWFLALHRPGSGSSPESSGPAASASQPTSAAQASQHNAGSESAPGASTPVYHGSAPGVEGLSRAIDRAHGAVAQSEQNARQLQQKSAQASESAPAQPSSPAQSGTSGAQSGTSGAQSGSASATSATGVRSGARTHARAAASAHASTSRHAATSSHPTAASGRQSATALANAQTATLQSELAHGQTVLLLFWNSKSTDDAAVRREAQAVVARSKGRTVLHVALPEQVGQYGSVTRGVQVIQTPTLLLIDRRGLAVTMTGLVDQYAIEQGISEAKRGSSSQ